MIISIDEIFILSTHFFSPSVLKALDIENIEVQDLGKINCILLSHEYHADSSRSGKFYKCEKYFLLNEEETLSFYDLDSTTMKKKISHVNGKSVEELKLSNEYEGLHSVFRDFAFWNPNIANAKTKQELFSLFSESIKRNKLKKEKLINEDKLLTIISNKQEVKCKKIVGEKCPVYTCETEDKNKDLIFYYHPNSSTNSLREYNLQDESSKIIDFNLNEENVEKLSSSAGKCSNEPEQYKYGCQLSLSHIRSIKKNCINEKIQKLLDYDLIKNDNYLTYLYTKQALNLKDQAFKTYNLLTESVSCSNSNNETMDLNVSVIDQNKADEILSEVSKVYLLEKYPQDGCMERAKIISTIIVDKFHLLPFKVFINGDVNSQSSPSIGWGSHVATAIKVKNKNGNVEIKIIDPLLSLSELIPYEEWLNSTGVSVQDFKNKVAPVDIQFAPYWSTYGEVEPLSKDKIEKMKIDCIECEFNWFNAEAVFNGYMSIDELKQ